MTSHYESLADYLAKTGQTQEALANALGIRQSQISNYIAGRAMPRPALALRIAAHTGVSVEALMRTRVGRVMEPKMSPLSFVLFWAGLILFDLLILAAAWRGLQVIARVIA